MDPGTDTCASTLASNLFRPFFLFLLFGALSACTWQSNLDDEVAKNLKLTTELNLVNQHKSQLATDLKIQKEEFDAQRRAFEVTQQTNEKITRQLANLMQEFRTLDELDLEIKAARGEAVEVIIEDGAAVPLVTEINERIRKIVSRNKEIMLRQKAGLERLEAEASKIETFQAAITQLKVELRAKNEEIAIYQKTINDLESVVRRQKQTLQYSETACQTSLEEKESTISFMKTDVEDARRTLRINQEETIKTQRKLEESSQQNQVLRQDNLTLSTGLQNCRQLVDSLSRLTKNVAECARVYYTIGSLNDLVRTGILQQRNNGKYQINENNLKINNEQFDFNLVKSIKVPSGRNYTVHHSRDNLFQIYDGSINFSNERIFTRKNNRYLVISYN